MKLPSYRRIYKNDYAEEYESLVEKLAVSINYGFDTLYDALNQRLNFEDNIASTIAEFSVTVDGSGNPTQKTQFKLKSSQTTVQGVIVLNCYGAKDPDVLPQGGIFVSFEKSENFVNINNIKGLTPNVLYTIKLLAIS
jgi:hypothetical protein